MTDAHVQRAELGAKKHQRAGWFAPIEDLPSARSAARSGAAAGLTLAGMNALGFVVELRSPAGLEEDLLAFVVAGWIIVVAILFLSWRVSTSRGHISAVVLLAFSPIQIGATAVNGGMGLFSIILSIAILAGILNGVRGCWRARKLRSLATMVERF